MAGREYATNLESLFGAELALRSESLHEATCPSGGGLAVILESLHEAICPSGYELNEVRLVLIGKTGVGKSSAGNTILGEELFPPVKGWNSGTEKCDWKTATRNGISMQVTDTPGVCDTHRSKEDVHREIAKCVATVAPGPHAVLMVIKAGDRFTKEEQQAYDELKRLFGEQITDFMIIVFTGLDRINPHSLENAMEKAPEPLKVIIKESHDRYIGFDNKLPMSERLKQGDDLLNLVKRMAIEKKGKYFCNDLVKRVEELLQEEMSTEETSREEIKEQIVKEKDPKLDEKLNTKTKGRLGKTCSVM